MNRLASTIAVALLALVTGCTDDKRLVEVFDNGPAGGPAGPSEGYIWVGTEALPPPGKGWKPTDPDTLTAAQRKLIR